MVNNSPSPDPKAAHVLVVDDEGAIRYSISKTLQRIGYQVTAVESGEKALEVMTDQNFDVVLTDIRMPGLTGVELLGKIKEQAPDSIVILMTGYASLGTAVESLRLGAHDYLIKPSSSQDIRASVARGLERAQNLQRRRMLLESIQANIKELTGTEPENNHRPNSFIPAQSTPSQPPMSTMTLGPLTIFPGKYEIQVGDKRLSLTPTEFDLLLYLAAHRGRVVPCYELVREVRGYTVAEKDAREVVRPHISNLRPRARWCGLTSAICGASWKKRGKTPI